MPARFYYNKPVKNIESTAIRHGDKYQCADSHYYQPQYHSFFKTCFT